MSNRFIHAQVEEWRETGFVIIPDFFTEAEIAPIREDFATLYSDRGQGDGVGAERNFKKEVKKRAICIICFRKETQDEEITTGHTIYNIRTVSSY